MANIENNIITKIDTDINNIPVILIIIILILYFCFWRIGILNI
jgi:hypothetical protein